MKKSNIRYGEKQFKEAVDEFENLLTTKAELEEKKDIQPFFKRHLYSFL